MKADKYNRLSKRKVRVTIKGITYTRVIKSKKGRLYITIKNNILTLRELIGV